MRKESPSDWKRKLDPSLLELAEIYKAYVGEKERLKLSSMDRRREEQGEEPSEETKKWIVEKMNQLVPSNAQGEWEEGLNAFYALSISAKEGRPVKIGDFDVSYEDVAARIPASIWLLEMMEFIAEQRYGRPLYQLVEEDRRHTKESSGKVLRIMQDAHKLRYGEGVQPPKGKMDHRIIFGFAIGRGLEKLTAEELAAFFDEFCPFCQGEHDPDALRRQRENFINQIQKALEWRPVDLPSS
jgi:hypothetical protein